MNTCANERRKLENGVERIRFSTNLLDVYSKLVLLCFLFSCVSRTDCESQIIIFFDLLIVIG